MKKFGKLIAPLAMVGLVVASSSTPAMAQRWHGGGGGWHGGGFHGGGFRGGWGGYRGGYRHGGDRAGLAIGAGLIGLGVGAAIASSNRDRYYDGYRGYYGRPAYYGYRGGYGDCVVQQRWDPYVGDYVPVRTCY